MYCPTNIILADSFTNSLQGALFHKFSDIIMGRVGPFTLLEDTFFYKSKERVGKHISSKYIPFGTGKSLKENQNILEGKNNKRYARA